MIVGTPTLLKETEAADLLKLFGGSFPALASRCAAEAVRKNGSRSFAEIG
jgi:hypothetical protein